MNIFDKQRYVSPSGNTYMQTSTLIACFRRGSRSDRLTTYFHWRLSFNAALGCIKMVRLGQMGSLGRVGGSSLPPLSLPLLFNDCRLTRCLPDAGLEDDGEVAELATGEDAAEAYCMDLVACCFDACCGWCCCFRYCECA